VEFGGEEKGDESKMGCGGGNKFGGIRRGWIWSKYIIQMYGNIIKKPTNCTQLRHTKKSKKNEWT
jgi:hypothetical protein